MTPTKLKQKSEKLIADIPTQKLRMLNGTIGLMWSKVIKMKPSVTKALSRALKIGYLAQIAFAVSRKI